MRNLTRTAIAAGLIGTAFLGGARLTLAAPPDAPAKAELKPEVAALLRQSTALYRDYKTYQATAVWTVKATGPDGNEVKQSFHYTLALERPNKFCFMTNEEPKDAAAVCDGKTFINYRGQGNQYIKKDAPATYKGINIVDDVIFRPFAAYIVALMLQGDALADKDVRAAFEKATLRPAVMEGGKKWDVIEMPFGQESQTVQVYVDAQTHLIGKSVMKLKGEGGQAEVTDTIEDVKVDKPIEASVFQFTPPDDAKQVEKFTNPETVNPDNALLTGVPQKENVASH